MTTRPKLVRVNGLYPEMPCEQCRQPFRPNHGSRIYCGKTCAKRADGGKNHRKRARKYGVHYEPVQPRYIYERDRWRCGICHARIDQTLVFPDPMSPSVDHILPMAAGGAHTPANLRAAHLQCNALKQDHAHAQGDQLMLFG